MRLLPILVFISAMFVSTSVNCQDATEKPFDWQPIIGFTVIGAKPYYDRNSAETKVQDDKVKINVGNILFVYNEPVEVETENGIVTGNSKITYVIIECNSGSLARIYTAMLDSKMPKITDKVLATHMYEKKDMFVIDKQDPLYHALCPRYI